MSENKLHDCKIPTTGENTGASLCAVEKALSLFIGKWKLQILHCLSDQTLRFSELQKMLPQVTQKMLTQQLRELENDGMVTRRVYAEVPSRVEYTITLIGKKLEPVLDSLCDWGREHMATINEAAPSEESSPTKQ